MSYQQIITREALVDMVERTKLPIKLTRDFGETIGSVTSMSIDDDGSLIATCELSDGTALEGRLG